jgi:prepilin-type N-terminal cleavage/methylation domain-containing protein
MPFGNTCMLLSGIDNFTNKHPIPGGVQPAKKTMTMSFKRAAAAGFTLIELLIVVIILAIISAIAIPQFSAATSDAQNSALDANLATIRNSIEQYKAQHTGFAYPGAVASSGTVTCPTGGTAGTGAANTEQAFKDQMQYPSNAAGQTCTVGDTTFRYGPYLRQGVPAESINNDNKVVVTSAGTAIAPATGAAGKGWAYDTKSGQFIMNSDAEDPNKKKYSAH